MISELKESKSINIVSELENTRCDICLEFKFESSREIKKCPSCEVPYHSDCLKSFTNTKSRACPKCEYQEKNPKTKPSCHLCVRSEGLLVLVDKNTWSHPSCLPFFQEIHQLPF